MISSDTISYINLSIAGMVVLGTIAVVVLAHVIPDGNLQKAKFDLNGNTAWATVFWGIWWLTLIPFYKLRTLHSPTPIVTLVLLDVGNGAMLSSAFALMGRKDFSPKIIWLILPFLILLLVWDASLVDYVAGNTLLKLVVIAPSAVLSHLALIVLGWAFVVRWGLYGATMFALCVLYALLQLPAYYVDHFHQLVDQKELAVGVFFALAVLKLPLAVLFFLFVISPTGPDFSNAQFLPAQSTPPSKRLTKPVLAFVVFVLGAVATSVIGAIVSKPTEDWIKSFVQTPSRDGIDKSVEPSDGSGVMK